MDYGKKAAEIHALMCKDPRFGYSWSPRWGEDGKAINFKIPSGTIGLRTGSYDCSSSTITAWKLALKGTGHDGKLDAATYTGNMRSVFVGSGLFEWKPMSFTASPGDLYLNEANHVAMCQKQSPDTLSEFCINEFGGVYGGKTGDQTGGESRIAAYYDFPWDGILHFKGSSTSTKPSPKVPSQPEYRIYRDGKWRKWRSNWESAGTYGTAIYDFDARYLGSGGWFQLTLDGGEVLPRNAHNDRHAKRVIGITVYYATTNPDKTGYYEAQYQVQTTSGAWLKIEHDDEDGGAGDDRNAICRFRLKIVKC